MVGRGGSAFLSVAATGLAIQAITAVSGPLVARMLAPAGRGEMVLIIVVSLMASQLAVGGLSTAIAYTVGQSGRPARDVVRSQLPRWMALSLVPGLATVIAVSSLLGRWAPALVGFALTTAYVWQLVLAAMVQGERNVKRINTFSLAGLLLYAMAVLVLFLAAPLRSPLAVLGVFITCVCLGLVVGVLMLRPSTGAAADAAEDAALRSLARRSHLSGVGLLDGLGLDLLLVGSVLGEAQLGLYQVGLSATNLPGIMLSGVGQVLLPRLSAAGGNAAALLRRWVAASVLADVVLVLAMEAIIDPLIRFAFGHEYFGVIGCARILIVAWGLLGLRRVLTAVTQAEGRAGYASAVEAVCLGVLVVTVAVAGHLYGINGAAYALGGTAFLGCVLLALRITWSGADRGAVAAQP